MPWLMDQVGEELEFERNARALLDLMIREVIAPLLLLIYCIINIHINILLIIQPITQVTELIVET